MSIAEANIPYTIVPIAKDLSIARRIWLETRASRWFLVGLLVFLVLILAAFLYPLLSHANPQAMHFKEKLLPPALFGGDWAYPLGTDQLGRDMLSRSLIGLQISFLIALASVVLAFLVGSAIGLYSGFRGGVVDQLLMRLVDVQLSIPRSSWRLQSSG
jgi:peptide/nickel transport system permease protein